ncbi:MAG: hypothetical protein RR022_04695 [Angelakisella sp.]
MYKRERPIGHHTIQHEPRTPGSQSGRRRKNPMLFLLLVVAMLFMVVALSGKLG